MKNLHKCPGESLEGAFLALEAKRDENTERKDYLPSEALVPLGANKVHKMVKF